MARFRRLDVLQTMMDSGLVPVFYHKDLETDKEGASSFFVSSSGPGRIEIMKGPESDKPHIAIRVTNFELACSILKGKGIEIGGAEDQKRCQVGLSQRRRPGGEPDSPLVE